MGVSVAYHDGGPATRAEPRLKMFHLASIRASGGDHRAHMLDVSRSGARLHCASALTCGQMIVLAVGGATMSGAILWERDGRIGIRFVTPLAQKQLEALLELR